jgi:hypothetical protein
MPVTWGDATPVKLADVLCILVAMPFRRKKKYRNIACDIKISLYICVANDRITEDKNKLS